jgi:predicted HAD superfamily Cof-like phosphohydrolase
MLKFQSQVAEFMVKAGQTIPPFPTAPDITTAVLRTQLIGEELSELADALGLSVNFVKNTSDGFSLIVDGSNGDEPDLVAAADACADLEYVNIGTAVAMGIDLEPVLEEVHRSNMTKFIDGYKDAAGKWVKGPSYQAAELSNLITAQFLSGETTQQKYEQLRTMGCPVGPGDRRRTETPG